MFVRSATGLRVFIFVIFAGVICFLLIYNSFKHEFFYYTSGVVYTISLGVLIGSNKHTGLSDCLVGVASTAL